MSSQKYEIKNQLATGDCLALEIVCSGMRAVPYQSKPAGRRDARPLRRVLAMQGRQNRFTT
jgi:hypothetical protein